MDPVKLFISYAHEDEVHKNNLVTHLSALQRLGVLEAWDDREIMAGQNWDTAIKTSLEQADIVIFLISADFIASEYIHDVEIENALKRYKAGQQIIIPVLVRACDFSSLHLSRFQALPTGAKPITSWDNLDEAWLNVTEGIKKVSTEMRGESLTEKVDDLGTEKIELKESKVTLHDFHQYTCDRREQQSKFDDWYLAQDQQKVQFYYIVGKEEQAHFGFVNRIAYEKGGRLLNVHHPEGYTSKLTIEEIVLENISSLSHLKVQLVKKILTILHINANANDPILTKNLAFICTQSPVVQKMNESDYISIQVSIYEDEWDEEEIPALAEWFIRTFCKDALPKHAPKFLFFFSIIYDECDQEVLDSVAKEIEKSEHINPLPELAKVTEKDLIRWFRKYKIIAPDKEVRASLMQAYFAEKEAFDMDEIQRSLKKIINDHNRG